MMRIAVAADRPIVLLGLRLALGREFAGSVIEPVTSAAQCLAVVARAHPDLTVVDVQLPSHALRQLCEALHESRTRSIFLTDSQPGALELVEARADAVVSHREGLPGVVRACRTVAEGDMYVSTTLLVGVLHGLIDRQRRGPHSRPAVERLSQRERQVLALLGAGCDQTEIARTLDIAPETAKTHIRHVLTKLGVRSRVEAAALANEIGFEVAVEVEVDRREPLDV
ncbi:response regulator transcription factor [Nocardioides mesophilus]|uniref:Response regulator transcription factor n=1 Tax=Nocardioides mesophilus TaxID=433659 RepID=A0A7G9R988_9ACTN|nr:response regulator transcription factor [Nocardioides mesophilus]QNN52163.1 response regulator transcription factor [Nocardioides mesophilus]